MQTNAHKKVVGLENVWWRKTVSLVPNAVSLQNYGSFYSLMYAFFFLSFIFMYLYVRECLMFFALILLQSVTIWITWQSRFLSMIIILGLFPWITQDKYRREKYASDYETKINKTDEKYKKKRKEKYLKKHRREEKIKAKYSNKEEGWAEAEKRVTETDEGLEERLETQLLSKKVNHGRSIPSAPRPFKRGTSKMYIYNVDFFFSLYIRMKYYTRLRIGVDYIVLETGLTNILLIHDTLIN